MRAPALDPAGLFFCVEIMSGLDCCDDHVVGALVALGRSSFKNAVSSLFDACPSVSSQQLFPGESGDEDPAAAGPGMGALVSAFDSLYTSLILCCNAAAMAVEHARTSSGRRAGLADR